MWFLYYRLIHEANSLKQMADPPSILWLRPRAVLHAFPTEFNDGDIEVSDEGRVFRNKSTTKEASLHSIYGFKSNSVGQYMFDVRYLAG